MEPSNKLYKVTLKGMTWSSTGTIYGVSYVVAKDPTEAYDKVRVFLNKGDIGYSKDRELHTVELLAEETQYPDSKHILFP